MRRGLWLALFAALVAGAAVLSRSRAPDHKPQSVKLEIRMPDPRGVHKAVELRGGPTDSSAPLIPCNSQGDCPVGFCCSGTLCQPCF